MDKLDTSFRIIVNYIVQEDILVTTIDCKFNDKQHTVHLFCTDMLDQYDLKIPKGMEDVISVRVNKEELIKAFRGLADALENNPE